MSNTGGADRSGGSSRLVRAYAVTRGRTHSQHYDLELETLVSTTTRGEASASSLDFERRSIVLLCRDVLSIAEIAARLDRPLGVAKVLVGDMADDLLVIVHRQAGSGVRTDLALLERVLDGLRAM
jgi:Protein of unknown function (DUF742)